MLPQFHYDFVMNYDIEFKPKGLLFYEITIPDEKTTIPVRNVMTEFSLPNKYHVTYAPDAKLSTNDESNDKSRLISWTDTNNPKFEYTILPLPKTSVPMVNIFWISLIVLFVTIFIVRIFWSRKS